MRTIALYGDTGSGKTTQIGLRHGMSFSEVGVAINQWVTESEREWCGTPMPLPHLGLVLEDRHPHADRVRKLQKIIDEGYPREKHAFACDDDVLGWREVNRWRKGSHKGIPGDVVIFRHEDGRTMWGIDPEAPRRNGMLFGPMETFDAWNFETELTAMESLAQVVTKRAFEMYVLTGSFLWSSKRSGLTYMFRRCRPTIAMTPHGRGADYFKPDALRDAGYEPGSGGMQILACLCLHPIGYYAGTFGGAMVPTDDVMAHYLLASGDEHMFWKRANHHHPQEPTSGL